MTRHRIVTILKSKTFWAGVAAAIGIVAGADAITFDVVIKAGAAILAGAGIRDSFTKIQTGTR